MMRCMIMTLGALTISLILTANSWGGDRILTMSTTTSTQSSGLLDILLPEFKKDTGIGVKVIAKGTGAAIRDGMDGNVDVIFVHAKGREEKFVQDGFGTKRFPVMHNDFVLIGPGEDPAGIRGETSAADALRKIAEKKATFISRGDDSGTHTKEQALWAESGIKLAERTRTIVKKGKMKKITAQWPADSSSWYLSIGQGMGKALTYTDEKQAYTLSDRGTYIKYRYGKTPPVELEVLVEGDKKLANPYGIIPINPKKYPQVKYAMAMELVKWLTGQRGQKLIGAYRLEGKQLFYPDVIR
ncbi:MAG: substrate-binding domain-containing protein [Desulfobulbaceae bacterium]|nr:substrate-binding domain-containing protein [Desulfobulbaceae bacterium]